MGLTVFEIMDEICDWLRANDIEPRDVPIEAVPDLSVEGRITCPVYLRRDGKLYVDGSGEAARGSVTVSLKVKPPAALYGWLAGLAAS
jgi:hypothetical protein